MKRWPFGITELLREEAPDGEAGGGGAAGGEVEIPKSFRVAGKNVDAATVEAALNLHNALADESIGPTIIEELARRSGILDKKGDLKISETAAANKLEGRMHKLLKGKLGKDYEKFADIMGPIMDEGIQEYLEEHRGSVETSRGESAWQSEVERFTDTHTITDDIGAKMQQLIERNGGVPALKGSKASQEYLDDMYEMAVKKLGIQIPDNPRERGRNRRDQDDAPEFREVARPKGVVSIDDIVDAAMRGQRFRN